MQNKNAYEIRLELLQMAREMLELNWHERNNQVWAVYNSLIDKQTLTTKEAQTLLEEYFPPNITTKEVINKAEELYEFVQK